jgi:uncharacterized membrane protein YuzA (DUF378 family)
MVTFPLVIIGALNWGLIGFFKFNLVMKIFGGAPTVEQIIYALVGLAALVEIFGHKGSCRYCGTSAGPQQQGM